MTRLMSLMEAHSAEDLRSGRANRTNETVGGGPICHELRNVRVNDHLLGPVLWLVCKLWPKKTFGHFPISSAEDAEKVAGLLFIPSGVFDSVRSLSKARMKSEKFCWRRQYMREPLQAADYACPQDINISIASDVLEVDDYEQIQEGSWSCKESEEVPGKACACGRSDLPSFRLDDIESLPDKARARIHSVPNGCDMVSMGQCYGECPYGFSPALVTGKFRPVCSTDCKESNHPVSCGFGCANTAGNCAKVTGQQVASVMRAVSQVAAMVTGHPQIHVLVDSLISLVEFTVTLLAKIIKLVARTWKGIQAGNKKLGVALAIFQFAAEIGLEVMGDMYQMKDKFHNVLQLFMGLINGEWKFGLNLGVIANAFMTNAHSVILVGSQLANAFVWPKCGVATATAVFSIDNVGDYRLRGEWMVQGAHSGRPRYTKIGDPMARIEWSQSRRAWRAYYDSSLFGVGRATLYICKDNDPSVPLLGWKTDKGMEPAPFLNEIVANHHDDDYDRGSSV
jgi:hypothetical protein